MAVYLITGASRGLGVSVASFCVTSIYTDHR